MCNSPLQQGSAQQGQSESGNVFKPLPCNCYTQPIISFSTHAAGKPKTNMHNFPLRCSISSAFQKCDTSKIPSLTTLYSIILIFILNKLFCKTTRLPKTTGYDHHVFHEEHPGVLLGRLFKKQGDYPSLPHLETNFQLLIQIIRH